MRNIKTPSVTQLLSKKELVRDFWSLIFQSIKKVPSILSSFINCSDILALCFRGGEINLLITFICFCLNFVIVMDHIVLTHNLRLYFCGEQLNSCHLASFIFCFYSKVFCDLFIFFYARQNQGGKGKVIASPRCLMGKYMKLIG